ncbi:MAG: acetate--CoA ligase family protein [Nanoarchaeota archaeon]|nr:acetate--CoA ligase family protein [Nanoarchaeota archaeon]
MHAEKTANILDFRQSRDILQTYSIPLPGSEIARTQHEVMQISRKIGYPISMKIVSPDISHKSDVGGVETKINNDKDAEKAYANILRNIKKNTPSARITGVLIQKMFSGTEIIIGMKRDQQFGPVILFGLGGIFVEIMQDVAMRIAPVKIDDAIEMIKEIKAYPILKGARGTKPAEIRKIAEIIIKVSELSIKEKSIKEIDLNPIIIEGKEINIVDIRIIK